MCEVDVERKGMDVFIICRLSGKPITISNEHGMFCEDMCQLDESIRCLQELEKLTREVSELKWMNWQSG